MTRGGGSAAVRSQSRWVRVGLALGMLVVAIPLVLNVVLTHRQRAATNTHVIASKFGVIVDPGVTRCQGGDYLPRRAALMKIYPGSKAARAGQPLSITWKNSGGAVAAHTFVPGGYPFKPLLVHIPPRPYDIQHGYLCIRNAGKARQSFGGNLYSDQPQAPFTVNTPYQRENVDEVRADYYFPGQASDLATAGLAAKRFALFKAPFIKPWFMWLCIGLVVALIAFGATVFLRSVREE